jgi:hypothetical protein
VLLAQLFEFGAPGLALFLGRFVVHISHGPAPFACGKRG